MIALPDHDVLDVLGSGSDSLLLRARSRADGTLVVVKLCATEHPTPAEVARWEREFRIARDLDLPGVVRPLAVRNFGHRIGLVMEDLGGTSLRALVPAGGMDLDRFFPAAVSLAEAVAAVHDANVVHRDLNPSNVIVDPATNTVRIIDFGIATRLRGGTVGAAASAPMEGTVAYLAPEQTGRMDRAVDDRSDLYALGATYFDMLAGRPPFHGGDPMEIVHAHVAVPAPSLTEIAGVPGPLAEVVALLLAKDPEDRYQSARGLAHDLRLLADQWAREQRLSAIELQREDGSREFRIPGRRYGRAEHVAALRAALVDAAAGRSRLVLILGQGGVGKSELARELAGPTLARHGHFLTGKCDQFTDGAPYASLAGAFRGLALRILQEPADKVQDWRMRLRDRLGGHAGVIAALIPELAPVLGDVPAPPDLGPIEGHNRLALAFTGLLAAVTEPGRPVVLCLDDLQWADDATLRLLGSVLSGSAAEHLLVVATARDDELPAGHALLRLLEVVPPVRLHRLLVEPLRPADVGDLIADTLHRPRAEVADLAAVVHSRTGGNAMFVVAFLRTLHADGLIAVDADGGGWCWDLDAIAARGVTDNVADLMARQIAEFPAPARAALQAAAVSGTVFDLAVVATAVETAVGPVAHALEQCRAAGLVHALGNDHERVLEQVDVAASAVRYRFAHDRIQQAACRDLDASDVAALRGRIGRHLRSRLAAGDAGVDVFTVVDHLNAAGGGVDADLARLNAQAARAARSATAYESAQRHLAAAIELLGPDGWDAEYDLMLDSSMHEAHAQTVLGRIEHGARVFDETTRRARTDVDRARICHLRSEALHGAGRAREAYLLGRAGLEYVGVEFPATAEDAETLVDRLLDDRTVAQLNALPVDDGSAELAGQLFWRALIGAFYSTPQDAPVIVAKSVESALQRGVTDDTALALGFLGMIANLRGRYAVGTALGELALSVGERCPSPLARSRSAAVAWCLDLAWSRPFEESEAALVQTGADSYALGDLEFVNHSRISAYISALLGGRDLGHVLTRCREWEDFCRTLAPLELGQARIRTRALRTLMGLATEPLDVEAIIADYDAAGDATDVCESLLELARLASVLQDHRAALDYARRAEAGVNAGSAGTLILLVLYRAHYAIACARTHLLDPDPALLDKLDELLAWLEPVAAFNPDNFASYVDLARAERATARGAEEAAGFYLRAIEHAGRHRYVFLEALATELFGLSCLARGVRMGAALLAEARALYRQCGAEGKAAALDAELGGGALPAALGTTAAGMAERFDLASVLKAAATIAEEVALPRVVDRLIAISMENAGAARGLFVAGTGAALKLVSERVAGRAEEMSHDASLELCGEFVPVGLIRSVARTGQAAVYADATLESSLAHDPYVRSLRPRSVLALPVARSGTVQGVLYLENALVAGAFTAARLALLEVLSGQMAISLENARLYANLEDAVAERTRELREALDYLQVAQRRIVEAEKLAALGGLVAGVAHEINTPIGVAVTATSHLVARTAQFRTAWEAQALKRSTLAEFVDAVESATRLLSTNLSRSADLVESFKQVAVDQSSEARRTVAVDEHLRDVVSSLGPRIAATPHAVDVEAPAGLRLTTFPGALAQLTTNLVLNSLVHAFPDGRAGRIEVRAERAGTGIRIAYADDGIGMSPEIAQRAFEPFFTTRRTTGGSGLGLNVVYNVVTQRLGGTIELDGGEGSGAVFTVYLPDLESS